MNFGSVDEGMDDPVPQGEFILYLGSNEEDSRENGS